MVRSGGDMGGRFGIRQKNNDVVMRLWRWLVPHECFNANSMVLYFCATADFVEHGVNRINTGDRA